jgi:transmembrane sensor
LWLVRLQGDHATDADRAEFRAWLAADPRHAAAFKSVTSAVEGVRALKGELRGAAAFEARPRREHRVVIAGAGLALAAAALLGVLWLRDARPQHYATAVGEQREVTLGDGSVVELNTNSEITVRFNSEGRNVGLVRGEALFQVRRDPGRMFEVEADGRSVRALGTAFVVRMDGAALKVTVTEGMVDVGSARPRLAPSALVVGQRGRARVSARQRLDISDQGSVLTHLNEEEIARSLAWRDGMLRFDGELLRDVVKDVERHTGANFVIANSELEELHVVAYLRANNLDGFISGLEESFPDIAVRRSGDRVRIEHRAGRAR